MLHGLPSALRSENVGTYRASVVWKRREDEQFTNNRYSRAHEWLFDGGARVPASAAPSHVRLPFSDPTAVDPEEAYVAALSSCHMLFFLWLAAKHGFSVISYEDEAIGEMAQADDGREWIAKVRLRPKVAFDGEKRPSQADISSLHHVAHERCYLANSVKTEVLVETPAHPVS
jgi:organic hydroperoxide reductase OsmC/OhrA